MHVIHQTMPTVRRGRLYQVGRESVPIDVGTPSWYDWLEKHSLFLIIDHVGAVTVRKNGTDRGESQWKASRTRMGKSFTISLGPSHTRLHETLGGDLTLVCAPAGFGKSTLLAQWVQTIDRKHAWLSLDEHDNELPVFVQSLAASLQMAFPDAFGATAALFKAPRLLPPDHIAILINNDLADVPDDVILVLDEYHLIHNREIHTLLELLVGHLPSQLHLVLICRSDPPLPVARWLAKGHLIELRGTDLRFTPEEPAETPFTGTTPMTSTRIDISRLRRVNRTTRPGASKSG
jgi:hypothetical protein